MRLGQEVQALPRRLSAADALASGGPKGGWDTPPGELVPPRGEVHVWRAGLECPQRARDRLAEDLSEGERARAARITREDAARRWLVGRALLRRLLGRYLRTPPRELRLTTEPGGKLVLAGGPPLAFNLAHSGSVVLYAVTGGERVGVDVERVRGGIDTSRVTERLFSQAERAALAELPEDRRREAFFSCWTRREAYGKAIGTGLRAPFSGGDRPLGWAVWDLAPAPGHAGAVVVEGQGLELRSWDLGLAVPYP